HTKYKQGATCRRGHPPTSAPKSRLSIAPVHDQSALSRFRGYNREQLWPLLEAKSVVLMKFSPRSAPGGWVRCTARETLAWSAQWQSKSCRRNYRTTQCTSSGSNAKPKTSPASIIHTFSFCTTSVRKTG